MDHTADVNLTYSNIAREYLLREGLPPDLVIKTGSPMYEVLMHNMPNIEKSEILKQLGLNSYSYFLVSAHRSENIESEVNFEKLSSLLNEVAEYFDLQILVSTHPRTRSKIDLTGKAFHKNISLLKPLGFCDYVKLQMNAKAVLSDSGTISEEASILKFPALNIREAHERPEAMEEATVMMTGLETKRVLQALQILEMPLLSDADHTRLVADYDVPNVSIKVLKLFRAIQTTCSENLEKILKL